MKKSCKLIFTSVLLTYFAHLSLCVIAQQKKLNDKPNIIVIVSDDAGYADFGCYGGKQISTPNIDAIAKSGTLFTNAYVTASVCAPSRAGLLTGRYPQRFGFEFNISAKPADGYQISDIGMDPKEFTIGNEMHANGYKTIAIGKWHQGDHERHFPLNRGFDEFYGFISGHRDFFSFKKQPNAVHSLYHNRNIIAEEKITYLTDMFTDKATSFINENKKNPFFIYLAYNAVHVPMQAKKELVNKYAHIPDSGRRTYAAMMTSLDDGVGTIMKTIKENNMDENTLVIFINDNGATAANSSSNGYLRGMKGSNWEGGIRVAFLMKWTGKIAANKTYSQPVSSLDILPTAIAAASRKQKGTNKLDGVNLLPYLNPVNKKLPHEALFWRSGLTAAVRAGKWKLIRVSTRPTLLFDLENDVSETKDLANKYPEKVKELMTKLTDWEKGIDKPHWYSPRD